MQLRGPKETIPTAAGLAYAKLRGDILRGVLMPLERLRVNDIAGRYGCTINDLRKWNGIQGSVIHPGQKLKVAKS